MKNYSIFIKQNAQNNKIEDVLLVETGFNWKACAFSMVWLIFNRLWLFSFLFFLCCSFAELIFSPFANATFFCMFCVLLGFEAENALFYRLKKEKYYFVGFSIGVDESDAKMKFLEQINKQNKIEDKLMTF